MKRIFILINIAIFQIVLSQSNYKQYDFFNGYDDYLANNPMRPEIVGNAKEITKQYIQFSDYKFKENDRKAKEARLAWALSDGKDLYFNMADASYIYTYNIYAKFNIINDNYMVILLDEKRDRKAIGYNAPYGGGIVGAVLNMKPKSSWKDKDGNSFKILLIEKNKLIRHDGKRSHRVIAYLVDTKKILELTNNNPEIIEKLRKDNYKVEDFLQLINE